MKKSDIFRSAILAGICISIGGWVFLSLNSTKLLSCLGAILFTFGLLTVLHFKYKLFTGAVGFAPPSKEGISDLTIILGGNIVGCLLVALLARLSPMDLCGTATKLLGARLASGPLKCGLLAIGCGFIMTAAVYHGRKGNYLPTLFGVPVFILCGFPHCVADAFYYLCVPFNQLEWNVLLLYLSIVLGNSVGGNLYRWILPEKE